MEGSLIAQIVGSSAVAAVIGAVITAFVNRRKLSAEATSIISQAAGGIVERLEAESVRLTGENGILRAKMAERDERDRERDEADRRRDRRIEQFVSELRQHKAFDEMLIAKLAEKGIVVEPLVIVIPEEILNDGPG